jgi:outer membrane lipoprotein-sorting protein
MKRKFSLIALLAAVLALPLLSPAQEGPLDPAEPKGITVDQIIQRFAAKEKEFKQARDNYTYRQDVKVQTVDGGVVDGEYHQVVDVTFDDQGRRQERVVFAPQSSLQRISMTREDVDDIQHRLPFVLTSDEIPEYQILYAGQQQEDELHCYVFDVAPKRMEGNKRYFQGRIWVDDHDFQIVKTHGKTVPDLVNGKPVTHNSKRGKPGDENFFPAFTTWREQVDGKYWFPTYTKADDELHFSGGDVHIREIVKYSNYKRFGSNVKITYEGQELPKGQAGQPPQPGQPQAQQQKPPQNWFLVSRCSALR